MSLVTNRLLTSLVVLTAFAATLARLPAALLL